jgi:hypothetical protein
MICLQLAAQSLLLVVGGTPLRMPVRIASYAASLGLLALLPLARWKHPALPWAIAVMAIVPLGLLHPEASTLKAGVAQIAMYAAVLAPLLWMSRVRMNERWFRVVVLMIWGFNVASATVGVVQTRFGWLQPEISIVLQEQGLDHIESLTITLSDGTRVFRPMGLSDTPGSAAVAGMLAILLGSGILLTERSTALKLLSLIGSAAGVFCILLAQVRSIMIMTGFGLLTLVVVLSLLGSRRALRRLMLGAGLAVACGVIWGLAVGGEETVARILSLVAEDPRMIYYQNRGHFLEFTFGELLPRYPLGAGLGRWGMSHAYFGNEINSIWAEIQWTGWLLDGGVPLMLAYTAAILAGTLACWRIAKRRNGSLSLWGAVLVSYSLAVLLVTFNSPVFQSELGLQFWLLNASLFAAAGAGRVEGRPDA